MLIQRCKLLMYVVYMMEGFDKKSLRKIYMYQFLKKVPPPTSQTGTFGSC